MSMEPYEKRIQSLTDTPFGYTLSMIGGKWRLVILYWLVEYEAIRFNELQRKIGTITYKTLSAQLKEMGSGRPRSAQRVPPNPAESGIQPFRQGPFPSPHYGGHVPVGARPQRKILLAHKTTGVPGFFCGLIFPCRPVPLRELRIPANFKVPFEKSYSLSIFRLGSWL